MIPVPCLTCTNGVNLYWPNNHRVVMFNTNQIPAPKADVSTFGGFDTYCNICGFPAYNVLESRISPP